MAEKRTNDIFTASGTLITPSVRELQLEFHELARKRKEVLAELKPMRDLYKELRMTASRADPRFGKPIAAIMEARPIMTDIDNRMAAICRLVEATHVKMQGGRNDRPAVATMGKPKEDA